MASSGRKSILLVVIALGAIMFLSNISDDFLYLPEETVFTFQIKETGEFLKGEVFFDGYSQGLLGNGSIEVSHLNKTPKSIMIAGTDKEEKYMVEYYFPEDYLDYNEIIFEVSDEDMEFYKKHYFHQIEDNNLNVDFPHFKNSAITWRIEDEDQCWAEEKERIYKAFIEIENASNGTLKFFETTSDPDIRINCYINFTKYYNEGLEELESKKVCSNITLEGYHTEISNYQLGLSYPYYKLSVENSYDKAANQTTWEVCKVNINELDIDPEVIFEEDKKLSDYLFGEGGITNYSGKIILKSEVNFLGETNVIHACSSGFPLTEIHEILHALGFDHIVEEDLFEYSSDVLYPRRVCRDQLSINQHYSDCLRYIYSNGNDRWCSGANFML